MLFFSNLKSCFVSAPILVAPDSFRQFLVEVDASEVGVGAGTVLSQRSSSDDRIHPCAFFSHRLSPAEQNYDIGNRELLEPRPGPGTRGRKNRHIQDTNIIPITD